MNNDITGKSPGAITKTPIVLCRPEGAAHLLSEGRRLVCLVRHGQTDWNTVRRLQGREAVPLNEKGRSQSVECGRLLCKARDEGFEIAGVFTSPLGRAIETAKSITDELGVEEATVEPLLIERDYGELSGLTMEERKKVYRRGNLDPEAESIPDASARMKEALVKLISSDGNGAVVAVTHGGVINALFSCVTLGRIGTGKNFSENCGISLVAVGKDVTIPLAYGLTDGVFLEYIKKFVSSSGRC